MNSKNCPKWWNFAKSGRTDADLGWRYQVIGGPLDGGPVTLAECIVFSESTHFLFFSKTNFTGKTLGFRWDPNAQPLGHEATDGPLCHGECQFSIFWFTPPSLRAFFCLLFETNISGKKCCFSNHKQGQVEREIFKRWRSISKANLNDWRNIWKKQQIKRALHRFESAMFRRDIFVFVFLVIIMKRQ